MNNEIDLLDELEREERDERLAAGGGGAGAALGVLLTFVIGCGLVFASYKLGQRKTVDEPPLIAANDAPIKVSPDDAGGSIIPNTDNLANVMLDGNRPAASDYALRDGVIVEANLPDRSIDQVASTAETREIRREVTQLTGLEAKTTIAGEPSLSIDGAPDRSEEQLIVASGDVVPNTTSALPEIVITEASAESYVPAAGDVTFTAGTDATLPSAIDGTTPAPIEVTLPPEVVVSDTIIAPQSAIVANVEEPQGLQITTRLPTPKPNLVPSRARQIVAENIETIPALAPETRTIRPQIRQQLEPAIARLPTPALAPVQQRQNQLVQPVPVPEISTTPSVQRVRVPPQPIGDAQVQLGAFPSPGEVRGRWANIRARHPDLLGQLGLQVLPVQTSDGRQLFRMRIGPLRDTVRAAQLCQALAGRGVDCFVPQRR